jgi:hypothetical protein
LALAYLNTKHIGKVSVALRNQRDDRLAFAGVLDGKLESIAQALRGTNVFCAPGLRA